jgi:hypothetical protein
MVGTHFLLHVFCPPGPPTSPLLNCIIPQERHPFSMVIFSNADLCNTISLRFPSGWYPGTTPLHSLIEEKEWELVAWRLCGIDWDEIRSICSDTAANIEVMMQRFRRDSFFQSGNHNKYLYYNNNDNSNKSGFIKCKKVNLLIQLLYSRWKCSGS